MDSTNLLYALLASPVIGSLAIFMIGTKRIIERLGVAFSAVVFTISLILTRQVLVFGPVEGLSGILYLDSLGCYLIDMISFVSLLGSLYSVGYMTTELEEGHSSLGQLKIYYGVLHLFVATMLVTSATDNLGVMWVGVEATTLTSAVLVGLHNTDKSVEAAWKYLIICSVGIGFAMLGTILLYFSAREAIGESMDGLNWRVLLQHASELHPRSLRLAWILMLLGYGTKVGLVPMHTWLPDAHSQAPAPVSAMLSAVLLNTAVYAIIRVNGVVSLSLGSTYSGQLLVAFGLLSIAVASIFLLTQKEYKRMLAYSSIEHMGIVVFGLGVSSIAAGTGSGVGAGTANGIGAGVGAAVAGVGGAVGAGAGIGVGTGASLALLGAVLHLLFHSVTKSLLFFSSGDIYLTYGTRRSGKVRGLMQAAPLTGLAFLVGLLCIVGTPGLSIFVSEFYILSGAFGSVPAYLPVIMLAFLCLAFAGMIHAVMPMLLGSQSGAAEGPQSGGSRTDAGCQRLLVNCVAKAEAASEPDTAYELDGASSASPVVAGRGSKRFAASRLVLVVLMLLVVVFGLYLPAPLKSLVDSVVGIIGGTIL